VIQTALRGGFFLRAGIVIADFTFLWYIIAANREMLE